MTRSLAPLLCLGLATCGPPMDEEPLACRNVDEGIASIGAQDTSNGFLPVADQSELLIQFGPQGMHMVTVSLRVDNFEMPRAGSGGTHVTLALIQDGIVQGGTVGNLSPTLVVGNRVEFHAVRAIITEAEIGKMVGRPAQMRADIEDGCGRLLSTAVTMTVVD